MFQKFILLMYLITPFYTFSQDKINWLSWDEMISTREKDSIKKKVFIDLYTEWCGWCKKMDASSFIDPTIVNYMNSKYYPVKFDAETRDTIVFNGHQFINTDPGYINSNPRARGKTHWFAHSILDGNLSYPSYVILDENLTRTMVFKGYKNQEILLGILIFFATDQYKFYHNYLNSIWQQSINTSK